MCVILDAGIQWWGGQGDVGVQPPLELQVFNKNMKYVGVK